MPTFVKAVSPFVLVCALAACPSSALASTHCGRVYVPAYHHTAKVQIRSGFATCSGARGLIRDAFTASAYRRPSGFDRYTGRYWSVRGWHCSSGLGASQAFCSQGRRHIDGSFRSDDGWYF